MDTLLVGREGSMMLVSIPMLPPVIFVAVPTEFPSVAQADAEPGSFMMMRKREFVRVTAPPFPIYEEVV